MLYGTRNFDSKAAQEKELLADLLLQTGYSEVYPASLAQQRLWFLDQLQGKSSAYNVHLGLWLRGPLDLDSLRASLQEIVNRHDSLRTAFKLERGELRQMVERKLTVNLQIDDVTHLQKQEEAYSEAYHLAEREVEVPFDLREAPLFRTRIIRVTGTDHVLLCTMHHIVTDSWSIEILARQLAAVYSAFSAGKPSPLSDLPIGYGDYSEWQRQWLGTEPVHQQLTYWKNRLENAPPVLELPKDGPRPPEQTSRGASQLVQLADQVITGVKQLAARWQTTPFILLLAAFKILLYRYSGQPDLLVGVPVAGRNRVETEGLIGFFVNTLVLRDDLSGNPRFPDLAAQVRETTLDAFANADVPFEKVVEVLKPERNLSYNPIFQVMFSMIKSAVRSHSFGNLTAFPYVVSPTTSIFDLSATLIEGVDGLWWVQIDHNTDLFHSKRVGRMLEDYITVLQGIVGDPEARILDLPPAGTDWDGVARTSLPVSVVRKSVGASKSTGKQQRLSSSLPETEPERREEFTIEQKLLFAIWKEVLGVPEIGAHDNFFDVGGHSLLAARLIAEIERATGRKIPVSAVFRAPTIEAFARLLEDDSIAAPDSILMKLGEGGTSIPFFAVAIPGVDALGFAQLAHQLSPLHPVYKLQATAPVIIERPFSKTELEQLCNDYLRGVRSIQPRGPYCLGSMCGSVVVAQEMIRQLESEGEEVALFTILDTWVVENSLIKSLWALNRYVQRFREWRARPFDEQFATLRRTIARWVASGKEVSGTSWERAIWPGENWQPPRFRAPVLLFRSPRQPYYRPRDPEMGWGARSLGGVEICEIECRHIEMLRDPHVRLVSEKLKKRLYMIMRDDGSGSASLAKKDQPSSSKSDAWAGSTA
ncbi:MAG: condensation domain-containing protein [Terriglobales bacterium]|jgi:thioesterase domain-containing protein/acyl carrier protein